MMSGGAEADTNKTPHRRTRRRKKPTTTTLNEEPETPKTRLRATRKASDYADGNAATPSMKARRINGTTRASAWPSYSFKRGVGTNLKNHAPSFRVHYKKRLRTLLKKLILRHDWDRASGVLAVFIKATVRDKSTRHNRVKYWAALEILKHKEGGDMRLATVESVYDCWMIRAGSKSRDGKESLAIQVELILYCLTHGHLDDAHQYVKGLTQECNMEKDPLSNLVVGLTFYELWFSYLLQECQLKKLNYTVGSMQSEVHEARANSDEYDATESQENNFSVEVNSFTSVAKDKENMDEVDSSQERVPMDVADNLQTQSPQQSLSHGDSYVYSAEGSEDIRSLSPAHDNGPPVSIYQAPGLPPWLLPLKITPTDDNLKDVINVHRDCQNDYYKDAVKHLKAALHSTPPMVEALQPLIQVLLINDRVNEALHELDNCIDDSATTLKLRLKVGLLEHFDRGNHLQLSSCYEEIMEIDPRCSNSMAKLIKMHQRGDYGTEKLVNMLGLHLDATYAEFSIWKNLASSLLKLSQCAGDQMSICLNGNEEEINQSYTGHSNQIPELFTHGESGRTWRFRCRWWLTRHFSSSILALEISAGEFELLAYKAAVAAFLHGPQSKYVTKAIEILENESSNQELCSLLRIHVRNYVGISKL